MEIAAKKIIKMDMVDTMKRTTEASWPLYSEADSFTSFVYNSQGLGSSLTFNADQRRKVASELLEVLERAPTDLNEPYSGWLEEPMDLEVFGQSLEQSLRIPLDEVHASHQFLEPSSPLVSEPSTPLAPTSPQDLYAPQDDQIAIKTAEPILAVPNSEELLESLESFLHQLNSNDAASVLSSVASPEQSQESDDDTSAALLDSIITEHVDERQLLDELAEFSNVLLQTSQQGLPLQTQPFEQTLNISIPSFCIDSEGESTCSTSLNDSLDSTPTTPRRRGRKPQTVVEPVSSRKSRKKTAKPEEKRLRKKEQNKTAATRYRIKKKAELDLLLDEEAKLEERNRELQKQYDDLASEIRYLKKLFGEVITGRPAKRL